MGRVEVPLGDALFVVEMDFPKLHCKNRWQDTTHFHVDSEIHVILSGNALIEISGEDVQVNQGDVCLLAPKSSHYPKHCSENIGKINFSFSLIQNCNYSGTGKNFSEYRYYGNILKSISKYFIINDTAMLSIVKELCAQEFSDENEHIYHVLLSAFFITLAKRIKERYLLEKEPYVYSVSGNENSFRQRKTVEEFFQKRYCEDINIEDLAKELCVSVPQTHRIVKKVFGVGFKKTLIKQRIEHACMLIKQNDFALTDIAYRCGYTSYNGFLAAFRSYMGKSPKEYQKSVR